MTPTYVLSLLMSTLRQTVKMTKFKTQFGVQDKSYQVFFFPAGIWSLSCVLFMPQVADKEAPASSGSPSVALRWGGLQISDDCIFVSWFPAPGSRDKRLGEWLSPQNNRNFLGKKERSCWPGALERADLLMSLSLPAPLAGPVVSLAESAPESWVASSQPVPL